jgi:hypothetical protein
VDARQVTVAAVKDLCDELLVTTALDAVGAYGL